MAEGTSKKPTIIDPELAVELGKRIAATGKWVARNGQVVLDPVSKTRYRKLPNAWVNQMDHGTVPPKSASEMGRGFDACARAIANGPDLTDAVTALSLKLDIKGWSLSHDETNDWFTIERGYRGTEAQGTVCDGTTLAEVVATAWIFEYEVRSLDGIPIG